MVELAHTLFRQDARRLRLDTLVRLVEGLRACDWLQLLNSSPIR